MKILFGHQIFEMQNFGGISRYFACLKDGLGRLPNVKLDDSIASSHNAYLECGPYMFANNINRLLPQRYKSVLNNSKLKLKLRKSNYDIYHPTYYTDISGQNLRGKPFVVTVFDMIHEIFPENFSKTDPTSKNKREMVEKAHKVIAISESTKQDLIKYFGVSDNKVDVVYLAGFDRIEKCSSVDIELPQSYILFVGNRDRYKNFLFALMSLVPLLQKNKSLSVLCAGGGVFSKKELSVIKSLSLESQVKQISVSDSHLIECYKNAQVLIYPSLYEGFGLPLLEAMQSGCPVACSNSSSLPEVCGEAALYFDPTVSVEILTQVEKLIYDNELNLRMKGLGKQQAQRFTWEKCALETLKVYESLL